MPTPTFRTTRRILRTRKDPASPLAALDDLLNSASPHPTRLFDHGLQLLVQELKADQAFICRDAELGMEVFWWATADGAAPDLAVQELAYDLCPQVLQDTLGALVLQAPAPPQDGRRHLGVRSFLGVPLANPSPVVGVLAVLSWQPRNFTRGEIAMTKAVAALFGKTLEIEQLKFDLHRTRDALDLTNAVMEDGLLQSVASDLPNLRHLDVWMKPSLAVARRLGEAMTLVAWRMPHEAKALNELREFARNLRGEDLLVDLGRDEFLLLLPRTGQAGAERLLADLRGRLGNLPMGATIWDPALQGEHPDPLLDRAQKRAKVALKASRDGGVEGYAAVVWDLPEAGEGAGLERSGASTRGRSEAWKKA